MNSKKRGRLLASLMVLAMLCAMLPAGAPASERPAGGGGAAITVAEAVYSVTADSAITGGSVAVQPAGGVPGDTITVTVSPDSGKQLVAGSLQYTADSGGAGTAISVAGSVYSFTLPAADVVVTARFADIISKPPAVVPMAAISADGATVTGGDTITANGTYNVAADATGAIRINDGLDVTLAGSGAAGEPNRELSVECGEGVTLTIRDLFVSNTADINLLNFTGSGNRLLAAGVNVLEGTEYNAKAVIHVGPESDLTIDGADADGTLYLYKYTAGSGIGGDEHEANGEINFAGGNLFIKGSKTGAVIGNDTCGDETLEAQIGDITISGGRIYIEANARGAAIGGSAMSVGGNVYMTGGTLAIYVDWTGSAIGAGGSKRAEAGANCGNLIVTGGSLKVFVDQNAAYDWGVTKEMVCDNPITAAKVNALNGGDPVYRYMLDVSGIEADINGEYAVTVDGAPYYTGGVHDYEYTANQESTMANWTKTNADSHIYLYLTLGAHTVSVNGQELGSIEVVEPDYSGDKVVIPEEQWSDAADTSWYNTAGTSFAIGTAAELAGLAAIVNAGTDDFSGKTVILTEDVNLSEREWTAIGTYNSATSTGAAFAGVFDGGGNTVSGLLIGDTLAVYHGLFGYVNGAILKNITAANGYVTGYQYVAGIAGYAVNSAITGCANKVTVWAVYQSVGGGGARLGGDRTGGIVGVGENCTILNCANYADVGGGCSVGGIAGNVTGGAVLNCANYGLVDVLRDGAAGIVYRVGADTIISGCINAGTIDGQSVGGIVGQTQDDNVTITNCANLGIIQTVSGGGIIDYVGSTAKNAVISKCFNSADIVGKDGGGTNIGGVVGTIGNGTVTDCYNTGAVATGQAAASQGVPGTAVTGGVIGIVQNGFDDNGITVRNCYSTGPVSSASTGPLRLGGVVGWEKKSAPSDITIANCYYLENSAAGGIDGADAAGAAESRTAAALQGLAPTLGAAYVADTAPSVNNGYPILAWQANTACTITFAPGMEGVAVTVTDSTGAAVAPDEAGGYVYTLSVGDTYTYAAAAEGYATVRGSLTPANDATVAINMFIYGDIYLDGKVNAKDAALLAQHLAGSQTLTTGQLAAADVYHDGKANAKDAALLAQFLAGQGVSLN